MYVVGEVELCDVEIGNFVFFCDGFGWVEIFVGKGGFGFVGSVCYDGNGVVGVVCFGDGFYWWKMVG